MLHYKYIASLFHINQVNKKRIRIPTSSFSIIFNETTSFRKYIYIHIYLHTMYNYVFAVSQS